MNIMMNSEAANTYFTITWPELQANTSQTTKWTFHAVLLYCPFTADLTGTFHLSSCISSSHPEVYVMGEGRNKTENKTLNSQASSWLLQISQSTRTNKRVKPWLNQHHLIKWKHLIWLKVTQSFLNSMCAPKRPAESLLFDMNLESWVYMECISSQNEIGTCAITPQNW